MMTFPDPLQLEHLTLTTALAALFLASLVALLVAVRLVAPVSLSPGLVGEVALRTFAAGLVLAAACEIGCVTSVGGAAAVAFVLVWIAQRGAFRRRLQGQARAVALGAAVLGVLANPVAWAHLVVAIPGLRAPSADEELRFARACRDLRRDAERALIEAKAAGKPLPVPSAAPGAPCRYAVAESASGDVAVTCPEHAPARAPVPPPHMILSDTSKLAGEEKALFERAVAAESAPVADGARVLARDGKRELVATPEAVQVREDGRVVWSQAAPEEMDQGAIAEGRALTIGKFRIVLWVLK